MRLRILEDGTTTNHRLGLAEIQLPARTDGPPQHRHGHHDEGFYVVRGTARFTVGEDSCDAPPARWSWCRQARRIRSPIPAMSP